MIEQGTKKRVAGAHRVAEAPGDVHVNGRASRDKPEAAMEASQPVAADFAWPEKLDLFGIGVTPTDYDRATAAIIQAAQAGAGGVVACQAVHAVVTAACDAELREKVNRFDLVTPDGQPVRWALNLLHGAGLQDRVYGPELTMRLCHRAAAEGVPVYFYGGGPAVVEELVRRMQEQLPELIVAGYESPPFRPLTEEEDAEMVRRVNESGAGLMFIGLGCPKQDHFAHDHRDRIAAVQLCVGAAFDFHAGRKSQAPRWMQRRGLEWLYRLIQEPRRLWRRYLVTNSIFVWKLTGALLAKPFRRRTGAS